ncbi:hypothetical protein LTR47_007165 [Exophiala xenobiotica]|nr:hypothetical protein LTR47_007165 [Exophiala xenobiotica]KAK5242744.1 hypothetical protein LTS06_011318 [Exophiala xenobiotica]KAK5260356.1 hypothetical protein LTR40_004305 [Exophiala xenobiotica]KAK5348208.1 hypothetical protein LTR61_008066 [Exophiala xenobiotica]KAK5362706.1 hypothetical protein LTR11_009396 [Exophiala xenobiotica]
MAVPTAERYEDVGEIGEEGTGQEVASSPDCGLAGWRVFSARRELRGIREDENKPWIEVMAAAIMAEDDPGAEDDRGAETDSRNQAGPDDERGIIRTFMHDPDTSDILQPQGECVEDYCFNATLEQLQAQARAGQKLPCTAWVAEGGDGWYKPAADWLPAHGLYAALKKPRFQWRKDRASRAAPTTTATATAGLVAVDPLISPATSTATVTDLTLTPSPSFTNKKPRSQTDQDEAPDIERRKIFIYDLDSWNICALVATASESQAIALRDAFFKYLTFRSSIEASLSDGWPTFRLSLHLPYYAWRCSSIPKADPRRNRRNHPLRGHRDVSLLNCEGGNAFLYEAQISFVLAGIDEWRWVAYCFVDSYFDEDGENAAQYHKDVSDGSHTDPFEYGVADKPTEQASTFFFKVFSIRAKQITQEWETVVTNVEKSIRQHAPSHAKRPTESPAQPVTDGAIAAYGDEIRKSLDWVGTAWSVLTELSEVLDKTSDAWADFLLVQLVKIEHLSSASRIGPSLSAIQESFRQLERLKKNIEFMAKRCSTMKQEVNIHRRDLGRGLLAFEDGELTVAFCTA